MAPASMRHDADLVDFDGRFGVMKTRANGLRYDGATIYPLIGRTLGVKTCAAAYPLLSRK